METKKRIITEEEREIQRDFARKVSDLVAGKGKKACVVTYGCQQNEADSERLAGELVSMGYTMVSSEKEADVILVNTCAVREHAELRALSITGGYKHLKEKNPDLIIGICGCMVSQVVRSETIKHSYPYVDFVFGTEHLWRLPEMLYAAIVGGRGFYPNVGEAVVCEGVPVHRESNFRAWVSIMYGCNNFCTYCIVPYVRGRERSRRPEDILAEVEGLVKDGYREITLLGQNVNSYGKEFGDECDFADLLDRVCAIPGDFIVRFMTSHPKDASHKLIDTIARNPKAAKHLHLPLQSGSDRLLREMNRHYDADTYRELVSYMREKMPDISLTTDIIIGFPGETEADFADTLSMLSEMKYDMLFSFLYSKREGTPAARMENQVPEDVKADRMKRLLALQEKIAEEKAKKEVGKVRSVLCEGESKNNPEKLTGRTEGNKIVLFDGELSLKGTFVNVKITEGAAFALYGEIVD